MLSKTQVWFFIIVLFIGLMTIPRVLIDFGADGDAVRGVKAAEGLWDTGAYIPSRLPGNPLFEYILAITVPWGGHITSNIVVFIFYIIGVGVFYLLTRERKSSLLLTGIFSLTPIILVTAATTMDYIPGLILLLCCYLCIIKKKYILAAIFLGLSVGFRLSNAIFLIPAILYMLSRRRSIYKIILWASFSLCLGSAFYIPIFLQKGFGMFIVPSSPLHGIPRILRASYNAIMLFGPVVTLGVLLLLIANWQKIGRSIKEEIRLKSSYFIVEITTIIIFIVLFLIHPDETAYLIPIIPFFYLLLSRWLSGRQLMFLGVLIISFAFFTVEFKGGSSGQREISFQPTYGIIVKDWIDRNEMKLLRSGIGRFEKSDKAIILTGMGAKLTYKNDALTLVSYQEMSPACREDGIWESKDIYRVSGRRVYLVYALSRENIAILRKEGFRIYIFSVEAPSVVINKYGYNPYEIGLEKLVVLNNAAFYK